MADNTPTLCAVCLSPATGVDVVHIEGNTATPLRHGKGRTITTCTLCHNQLNAGVPAVVHFCMALTKKGAACKNTLCYGTPEWATCGTHKNTTRPATLPINNKENDMEDIYCKLCDGYHLPEGPHHFDDIADQVADDRAFLCEYGVLVVPEGMGILSGACHKRHINAAAVKSCYHNRNLNR